MIKNLFNKINTFLTIRRLLIIIIVIATPLALYFIVDHFKKNKEHEKNELIRLKKEEAAKLILDSISKVKYWRILDYSEDIGLKTITLKTKYIDGMIYYSLACEITETNKLPHSPSFLDNMTIHFYDGDNFDIYKIKIPLPDFTYQTENGVRVGLVMDSKVQISKEKYLEFQDWTLSWQF